MRPSIHQTLMDIAFVMAQRGTCSRLQVGSVIARDTRIISTGYNGAPAGLQHCQHSPDNPTSCTIAAHAEENAVCYAAKAGISTNGATLYGTHAPCSNCARLIINAGIKQVYFAHAYRLTAGVDLLRSAGVIVNQPIKYRTESNV